MTAISTLVARIVNPVGLTAREQRTEEVHQRAIRARIKAEGLDPRLEALRRSYAEAERRLRR